MAKEEKMPDEPPLIRKGKRAIPTGQSAVKQYPIVPPKPTRGRKKLSESLSPKEIKQEIKDLLRDLEVSTDPDEKKRIRRALRLRGHWGGLGKVTRKKTVTVEHEPGEEALLEEDLDEEQEMMDEYNK
jgi:hypothetical protein